MWHLIRRHRWRRTMGAVEAQLVSATDEELRQRSLALRYRAKSGESLDRLLPEAFALVRVAGPRTVGMRHFEVQVLGGLAMHQGSVAEMQTGEGKTFTATLPLYLHGLTGKGVHLVTANDYLARRDAEWMRPLFESLGLSVGVVESGSSPDERRTAYACDVTYGTAREFGFDFLRDRLRNRDEQQRGFKVESFWADDGAFNPQPSTLNPQPSLGIRTHFALIDEADSVLIDEARTPLILSGGGTEDPETSSACHRWSAQVAPQFHEGQHFIYDADTKAVELTQPGRQMTRALPKPAPMQTVSQLLIYEAVERAIKVERDFIRDRHYVVRDGEVVIVDEFTGRLGEGRKWQAGIHQAVEAKEGLPISPDLAPVAGITVQELFLQYNRLAGMTGTASSSARELRKVYGLRVVPIPTHRPCLRVRWPDKIYPTTDAKWDAVVDEVKTMHQAGRPVLIGTRSIDKSEELAARLSQHGLNPQVLHAKHLAQEAQIIAEAGHPGGVTVATNMAGRGTDIRLAEGVAELGGLHVIGTEMHDSARIDRQLAGRCARQGDPGTFRQYLALDDDILCPAHINEPDASATASSRSPSDGLHLVDSGFPHSAFRSLLASRRFRAAQRKVERKHVRERRVLMHTFEQRKKLQTRLGQDPYLDVPE